jgi:hypothetical protein
MKLVLGLALLAAITAPLASADGDPASDYLYTRQVFVPYDLAIDPVAKRDFILAVSAANRRGFRIRVALIGNAFDLGAVPSFWRQPRTYARFLGAELAFVYKQRLLIVMPNGFGVYWKGHDVAREYALLRRVRIESGPTALAVAGRHAVEALSAG